MFRFFLFFWNSYKTVFNPNSNESARGFSGALLSQRMCEPRYRAEGARKVVVWTLGGRQALSLFWKKYFCDSCGSCPSLCPDHQSRSRGKIQALILYFLGAPPSQRICEPRYGKGIVEKGRGDLGQGRAAWARPENSPRKKLESRHAITPFNVVNIHHLMFSNWFSNEEISLLFLVYWT